MLGPYVELDAVLEHVTSTITNKVPGLHVASNLLQVLGNSTGLRWGPATPDLFWYRPPDLHVVEGILFLLFVQLLIYLSKGYFRAATRRVFRRGDAMPAPSMHWTSRLGRFFDAAFGLTFLLCFISQVVLKAIRPNAGVQIWWLVMPCHLITVLWAYVLLLSRRQEPAFCDYLATLAATFHWGPAGAAAVPDWSDHQFRIEGIIFVVHHGLLVLMPFYYAARFGLVRMSFKYFVHSTAIATFINVGPYTWLSYVTGLNVNYHLYPPPKLMKLGFFASKFYRFYVIAALIVLSVLCRTIIGAVGWTIGVLFRLLFSPRPKPSAPTAKEGAPAAVAARKHQ